MILERQRVFPSPMRVFLVPPNFSLPNVYSEIPEYRPRLRRRILQIVVYILFGLGYAAALAALVWVQS